MTAQPSLDCCTVLAEQTGIWLLACVNSEVLSEVILVVEVLGAVMTGKAIRRTHLKKNEICVR